MFTLCTDFVWDKFCYQVCLPDMELRPPFSPAIWSDLAPSPLLTVPGVLMNLDSRGSMKLTRDGPATHHNLTYSIHGSKGSEIHSYSAQLHFYENRFRANAEHSNSNIGTCCFLDSQDTLDVVYHDYTTMSIPINGMIGNEFQNRMWKKSEWMGCAEHKEHFQGRTATVQRPQHEACGIKGWLQVVLFTATYQLLLSFHRSTYPNLLRALAISLKMSGSNDDSINYFLSVFSQLDWILPESSSSVIAYAGFSSETGSVDERWTQPFLSMNACWRYVLLLALPQIPSHPRMEYAISGPQVLRQSRPRKLSNATTSKLLMILVKINH